MKQLVLNKFKMNQYQTFNTKYPTEALVLYKLYKKSKNHHLKSSIR